MEHPPVCPNCEAVLDLTQRNAIQPLVYRNVACPKCGFVPGQSEAGKESAAS